MGRAIVREPKVFLMDEPLSNLDAKLRVSTRTQIAALQRRLGITTVYVTHDQVEAMTMGDRVAVLKDGLLQQADSPLNLYDRPRNVFVAGFIGSPAMNLLEGKLVGEEAVVDGMTIPLEPAVRQRLGNDSTLTVGIRPEDFRVVPDGEQGLTVRVELVEELGADAYLYSMPDGNTDPDARQIVARVDTRRGLITGATRDARGRPGQGARVRRRLRRPRHRLGVRPAGRARVDGALDAVLRVRPAGAGHPRASVGDPARGLARGTDRRAPPRHLPARRAVRPGRRHRPRLQGDRPADGAAGERAAA